MTLAKRAILTLLSSLLLLFMPAGAYAQILVNKSFSPSNIPPAATSTLTIQILNNTATAASAVAVTDVLPSSPAGLVIGSGLLSNSCGGSVSAPSGGTTIALTGGSVPAAVAGVAGSCLITVQVKATPPAPPSTYLNTIPPSNVSSSIGGSTSSANATLTVPAPLGITGSKSFTPNNLHGNGPLSRLRIQLNNPNGYALTGVAFNDPFPSQIVLAATPNVSNSCGGTLTAVGGAASLSLTGGTIPATGNCVIQADVIAATPNTSPANGNARNRLSANSVTSTQGARNAANIDGNVLVQKAAQVTKTFAPAGIEPGATSVLTLTLFNYNATPITSFNFTDAMPTNVTVVPASVTTTCSGTLGSTSTSVSITGGTLAAAPTGSGSTSCRITATVTASISGSYTNSVPTSNLAGVSYGTASAVLQVSSISGTKAFNPTSIPRTGTSILTITLINRNSVSPASITSFTDNLATMNGASSGISIAPSPAATTTCGGTLTAASGTTLISMTGGSIPRATSPTVLGTCTITVPVQASSTATINTRTNTILAGAIATSLGSNPVAISATLAVTAPLTVSKAFSPATVVAGTTTRLTVTISRAAYAAFFTNLAVTDPLPPGFVVAATPAATTTCTGGSVSAVPPATSISLSSASLGTVLTSSSSCTFAVNITAASSNGSYVNTIPIGNATANTVAGSVANVTAASATATVISGVSLNKDFVPTTLVPGGTSRLTVYISNPASAGINLTGVALTDTFPTGLIVQTPPNASFSATSGTCSGTPTAVAGNPSFGISGASIASGSQCELAIDVTTSSIGSLTNTLNPGALTSTQGQTNTNTASASLVSSGSADIEVTKSDGVPTMIAGASTIYTATITNNSTVLSASGVPVSDPAPAGMTFSAWTCAATVGSACTSTSGTGPIATTVTLAPLGVTTFNVTSELSSAYVDPTIKNTFSADPASAGVFDPSSANNSADDINTVTQRADVRIEKMVSNPSPQIGDAVTFTIKVKNFGESDAVGVTVNEALASGYTFVGATPSVGSYTAPTWTIGALARDVEAVLTLVATVNPSGDYGNTATVSATTADQLLSNNTAVITPMTVGLRLEKTSVLISDPINGTVNPKVVPGAIIEYSITVRNEGTAAIDANTIVIEDFMPPGVSTFVSTGGGPPVTFTDGTTPSGLSLTYASDVSWSSTAGGGTPYSYSPSPDGAGFDMGVTGIRIAPTGTMAAGSVASPSSFVIKFRVRVN